MYQRTIEELQKDEREKVIIDIRREADFLRERSISTGRSLRRIRTRCPRTVQST
jgi:hypothetical protein